MSSPCEPSVGFACLRGNQARRRQDSIATDCQNRQLKHYRAVLGVDPRMGERDATLRPARQTETGAHMSQWLRSPGLRPEMTIGTSDDDGYLDEMSDQDIARFRVQASTSTSWRLLCCRAVRRSSA
jgi:hypothetical protein